jgi:primary-amine oxidase
VTHREIVGFETRPDVQPALLVEEYLEVERLVREDPRFIEAASRRGVSDFDLVCVDPVPAGTWGFADEVGRRVCRAIAFVRPSEGGNQYARPLEGILALVDLDAGAVVRVEDRGAVPLPDETGEFRAHELGPLRSDIRPLHITQPDGASFEVDGHQVRWQRWNFRVGFNAREGLVLHSVAYEDAGELRTILHRASYSEMAVPYGHPDRWFLGPFDIGENLIGRLADQLVLGCDCLGEIHYFDEAVIGDAGEVIELSHAICMHEEDHGILWKHTDYRTGATQSRRGRRLVISFISTIGNYVYGFFWYLYQDGTIETEVKLTGIMSTVAVAPDQAAEHGRLVAPGVNAPIHHHFFNARLDFDIDGVANTVYEVDAESSPGRPGAPAGTCFRTSARPYLSESDASGTVEPKTARTWLITNPSRSNAMGDPVAYQLVPGHNVALFSEPGSAYWKRAEFATRHVWVTAYDASERYAAGEYPNQAQRLDGLAQFSAANRPLENTDIVVWYSFGTLHVPRPEDWPVMPVTTIGFSLRPYGFFDRNPALDVPPSHPAHIPTTSGGNCAKW